jgi:AcrR family transcriptional regulator
MSDAAVVRRRLKPEVRRERLLEAAASVFAVGGYEAARIEQIAEAAGVSSGLLYRHFDGKRELYAELLRRADEELVRHVAAATDPELPSLSRLERGAGAVLEFVELHPDLWQLLIRDVVDPEIKLIRDRTHAHAVSVVAKQIALDPGLAELGLPAEEFERMAVLVVGATTALAYWWGFHPGVPRDELLRTLAGVLWLGFERVRDGERYPPDGDLTLP